MKRHSADSIGGAILLLGCGIALTVLSRKWGIGSDLMSQMAAFTGPVAILLGIGMVIHGTAMPLNRITPHGSCRRASMATLPKSRKRQSVARIIEGAGEQRHAADKVGNLLADPPLPLISAT